MMQPSDSRLERVDHRAVWQSRKRTQGEDSPSSKSEIKDVILKISDLEALKDLGNVPLDSVINLSENQWIVTTRIPRDKIQWILNFPWVISLEHSQSVFTT